jgi:hypothetical protein
MHQGRVRGNAVEPGAELRLAAKRCKVAVDLKKRVLEDIGSVGITGHPARESEDARLIAFHDRLEGRVVPGRGALRERFIARVHGGDDHAQSPARF